MSLKNIPLRGGTTAQHVTVKNVIALDETKDKIEEFPSCIWTQQLLGDHIHMNRSYR